MGLVPRNLVSPCRSFSHLLAEFPSGAWRLVKPTNYAGLLRSDRGGLSVSSPSGELEDACSLRRWRKFLVWNFIGFPHKPSYSASFLHWISLLSYPYLTTLYIFNSIISWSPKPSALRIPWIHWGWTLAVLKVNMKRKASRGKGIQGSCALWNSQWLPQWRAIASVLSKIKHFLSSLI